MVQQPEFTVPIETHTSEHDGSDKNALLKTNGLLARLELQKPEGSNMSIETKDLSLPPGSILTGKQEHCIVKGLIVTLLNVITIV